MAACLVVASCAHGGFSKVDLDTLPGKARYPDADGVVLFDRRTVELKLGEDGEPVAEETRHSRVRVLSEAGRKNLGVWVGAMAPWVELTELTARVITPAGDEVELSREDAVDVPAYGGAVLYQDARHIGFSFAEVAVGSVVEWRWRTRSTEPRLFTFSHALERSFPVEETRFDVIHPAGWSTRHVAYRLDERLPVPFTEQTLDDGRVQKSIVKEHVAPLPWEPLGPGAYTGTRVHVMLERWLEGGEEVTAFEDERALSTWMFERTDERSKPTPEIERLAREILKDSPDDPRDKTKRLYAWTRDNIAYCAIAVGYGGWFPHDAAETERLRYGDCKDKANLLRALLKSQGIESYLTGIYLHDGWPRPFVLPTMASNFNHEILVVDFPDGRVAMDPTTTTTPFGRLPAGDQGALTLPSTKDGARLWRTPLSSPDMNVSDLELEIELAPGEALRGTFSMTLDGVPADRLRHDLLGASGEARLEVVDARVPVYTHGVSDLVIENEAPPLDPVPLVARGKLEGRDRVSGDWSRYVFRLSAFVRDAAPALSAGPRRHAVVLGVPETRRDRVTFKLPKNAEIVKAPDPVALVSPFGRYELEARVVDNSLVFERTFVREATVVQPSDYAALKRFFDEVARAESRTSIIRFRGGRGA